MTKFEREILFKRLREKKISAKNFDPQAASPAEILIAANKMGEFIDGLSPREKDEFPYMWDEWWARPNQKDPGTQFKFWALIIGRGGGKTRTGAEWIKKRIEVDGARRIALVARSPAEAAKIMIFGTSGIMSVFPEEDRPTWNGSNLSLTWKNGAIAYAFSSYEPDKIRGYEYDTAWCDELAAWKKLDETWYNLTMTMRLPYPSPRYIITTTPRPLPIIKNWIKDSTEENSDVYVSYGDTFSNHFLDESFVKDMKKKYAGTRLGEQELYGRVLGDSDGALFSIRNIEENRFDITDDDNFPGRSMLERKLNFIKDNIIRIVVSIDPQMTKTRDETGGFDNCETGIVVAGIDKDGYGYLIEDCSKNATPLDWATTAVNAYHKYKADRIVAEKNQGGDMIEMTLRQVDDNISFKGVFGKKGKHTRAEPVSALYEQNKIRHLGTPDEYQKLESQMINWTPGEDSPDRMDAMVWAFLELMVDSGPTSGGVIEQPEYQQDYRTRRSTSSVFGDQGYSSIYGGSGSGYSSVFG